MVWHLTRIAGTCSFMLAFTFLPFLPGEPDTLSGILSVIAQVSGVGSLLFVFIGLPWLVYELRRRLSKQVASVQTNVGYIFGIASMLVFCIVAGIIALGSFASGNLSIGITTLILSAYMFFRFKPKLRQLKKAEAGSFNPTPLYLTGIPLVVALIQFSFLDSAAEFSRIRAITNSATLINDIEAYYKANGQYPQTLQSLLPDYKTSIMGIAQYHYKRNGNAYDLFFEQPISILHAGIREIVVYNKLDEHALNVHTIDILHLTPEALAVDASRGYFARYDTSIPHWKYFWFD